jgi:hypothetical protein
MHLICNRQHSHMAKKQWKEKRALCGKSFTCLSHKTEVLLRENSRSVVGIVTSDIIPLSYSQYFFVFNKWWIIRSTIYFSFRVPSRLVAISVKTDWFVILLKCLLKIETWVEDKAPWWGVCLSCVRSWFQSLSHQ